MQILVYLIYLIFTLYLFNRVLFINYKTAEPIVLKLIRIFLLRPSIELQFVENKKKTVSVLIVIWW